MIILNRAEIEALIDLPQTAIAIKAAYIAASRGEVVLPPVGHITFEQAQADCHIKYGHVHGAEVFVIKVATGFPMNADHGLPTGNGLVLVMSAKTGAVEAILHDEMMLTDVRTGLGGAIASHLMARQTSSRLLVCGTGPQARRQIEAHTALMPRLDQVEVWGRSPERVVELVNDTASIADVRAVTDLQHSVENADIIVTCTGATAPLFPSAWVQVGTHITAVGADAPGKQEWDTNLVARADLVAVDSLSQCVDHGEVSHAVTQGLCDPARFVELGTLLQAGPSARQSDAQITLADLTGIAAQDIVIAGAVLQAHGARDQ